MITSDSKVSIIVPTYNRSEFIGQAIQTILNQTYDNWELVIVNDGSDDNTEEIINSFNDNRICYYKHPENRGQPAARKTGIKNAAGDYIAFLDDDDFWESEKLSDQVQILDSDPSVDVAICNFKEIRGEKETLHSLSQYAGYCLKEILIQPKPVFLCLMIRSNIFSDLDQFFDDKLITSHEWDLLINLAINEHKFHYMDKYLVTWNVHEKSVSQNTEKEANGLSYIVGKHRQLMEYEIGKHHLANHYLRIGYLFEQSECWDSVQKAYGSAFEIDPFRLKIILFKMLSMIGLKLTSKGLNLFRKIKLAILG